MMLKIHMPSSQFLIHPTNTGYFVIFAGCDCIHARDFNATDEFEAVKMAFDVWGYDWQGLVTVENNEKWKEDPVLEFEHNN